MPTWSKPKNTEVLDHCPMLLLAWYTSFNEVLVWTHAT